MIEPCPLCGNTGSPEAVERVSYDVLRELYRRRFDIRIQPAPAAELTCVTCGSCGLIYYSPMVVGEPSLYEQLQRYPWYYMEDKPEFEAVLPHLKAGDTVLEVGCGTGNFAAHLPSSIRYRGLEFNDEAVKGATAKGLEVTRETLGAYCQRPDASVDFVCTFQVLEHVPRPDQFIGDMLLALKTGGILALSVPSEDSLMKYQLNNVLNAPPHHQTRWSDATLARVADLFGLELVSIVHESPPHPLNVPGFAMSALVRWLRQRMGIALPRFSLVVDSLPVKGVLGVLSLLFRPRLRRADCREHGHTVTAIYRKRSHPAA